MVINIEAIYKDYCAFCNNLDITPLPLPEWDSLPKEPHITKRPTEAKPKSDPIHRNSA
jgi:hypothetical protein